MIERYVCNVKTRGERKVTKGEERVEVCDGNERRAHVRRLNSFERCVCETLYLILSFTTIHTRIRLRS